MPSRNSGYFFPGPCGDCADRVSRISHEHVGIQSGILPPLNRDHIHSMTGRSAPALAMLCDRKGRVWGEGACEGVCATTYPDRRSKREGVRYERTSLDRESQARGCQRRSAPVEMKEEVESLWKLRGRVPRRKRPNSEISLSTPMQSAKALQELYILVDFLLSNRSSHTVTGVFTSIWDSLSSKTPELAIAMHMVWIMCIHHRQRGYIKEKRWF